MQLKVNSPALFNFNALVILLHGWVIYKEEELKEIVTFRELLLLFFINVFVGDYIFKFWLKNMLFQMFCFKSE